MDPGGTADVVGFSWRHFFLASGNLLCVPVTPSVGESPAAAA